MQTIEQSQERSAVKLEARRLYLVCLCAAFETYWRDFFRLTVDRYHIAVDGNNYLNRATFSYSDVRSIVGRKLTLGELVSATFTFQSTSTVNQAASEILGIDAFKRFAKAQFMLQEVPPTNPSKNNRSLMENTFTGLVALRRRSIIDKCFSIRHETVHHTGNRYRPSQAKVLEMDGAVFMFNTFFSLFVESRAEKLGKKT